MMRFLLPLLCIGQTLSLSASAADATTATERCEGVTAHLQLPPGPGNPRNSEGDFIALRDGRLMFVYTHFTGGGSDHAKAHLAARFSSDAGKTWTRKDVVVVPNEGGMNIMSVSLLRLANGKIALFYLQKNSLTDCRPLMRLSADEGKTWSEPIETISDKQMGYYVLNNDRVVQLKSGRLVVPVALHNTPQYKKPDWAGTIMAYLSDDGGKTWHRSKDQLVCKSPSGKRITLQEPGVVELNDGRLLMFARASGGFQQFSHSRDGGETWTPFVASTLASPVSPATIERIPSTGDLLVVWNDHGSTAKRPRGRRPFSAAISKDEGRSWRNVKRIEDKPNGHYCYTAMLFVDDHVLLGHCCGPGLGTTQVTRFPVAWLYADK